MNNKFNILKKSSTILLATVLVVGFIGISSPSSILAQYYDDDYESEYSQYYDDDYGKSYEKYMKNDDHGPIIKNIKCNNIIKNTPDNNNVDTTNALDLPNGNSQSGQDRTNADPKGNFVYVCKNNNTVNNIFNTVNNEDNSRSFIQNNTLQLSSSFSPTIQCGTATSVIEGDNSVNQSTSNFQTIGNFTCSASQNVTQNGNLTDNIQNNFPGVTSPSSVDNVEQPSVQTQQISSSQNNNGINIQQQQRTEDSSDLTAMEKITKLKTQWLNQLP